VKEEEEEEEEEDEIYCMLNKNASEVTVQEPQKRLTSDIWRHDSYVRDMTHIQET
jgi:hypothetical protein